MRRPTPIATAFLVVVLGACGGQAPATLEPSSGELSPPPSVLDPPIPSVQPEQSEGEPGEYPAWEFEAYEVDPDDYIVFEGEPEFSEPPPDVEEEFVIEAFEPTDEIPPEPVEVMELDPCSLIALAEWAAWKQVDIGSATTMDLHDGEACGYLTDEDDIRLGIGVVSSGDGTSWFLGDAPSEALLVAGRAATWVPNYPTSQSWVLMLPVRDAEIVLELVSRGSLDEDALQAGAIHFMTLALGRYSE